MVNRSAINTPPHDEPLFDVTADPVLNEIAERDPVSRILLEGGASTVREAEELYLNEHLDDVVRLVESPLSDSEFRNHPLIVLLLSHGSRAWEDSLI